MDVMSREEVARMIEIKLKSYVTIELNKAKLVNFGVFQALEKRVSKIENGNLTTNDMGK